MGATIGDGEQQTVGGINAQGDHIIPPPRANLYGDTRLPNGKTLSEMADKYVIPKSALNDSGVQIDEADTAIARREVKSHKYIKYDLVPASSHELDNKVR